MKKRNRERYSSLAEINITNLVDVIMVLLIAFMLTAPFLQAGVIYGQLFPPEGHAFGLVGLVGFRFTYGR